MDMTSTTPTESATQCLRCFNEADGRLLTQGGQPTVGYCKKCVENVLTTSMASDRDVLHKDKSYYARAVTNELP